MQRRITFAGGCFWGVEKYFSLLPGVVSTEVGYANGRTEHPTYEQVCHEDTGHAEAVRVSFDDAVLRLPFLLLRYFDVIDPTSLNRQGGDVGTQYRTGIYYEDAADRETCAQSLAELRQRIDKPIHVELLPLDNFYEAEEYHQKYLDKNPNGYCHIGKKMFDRARGALEEK